MSCLAHPNQLILQANAGNNEMKIDQAARNRARLLDSTLLLLRIKNIPVLQRRSGSFRVV